eukprot:3273710-Ditylum_brightwellii.AAC.1
MKNLADLETWSSVPKRNGYTKITSDVKKALVEWIVQHDSITHSSSKKEVINVKLDCCVDKDGGLEMAKDSEGKVIIGQ